MVITIITFFGVISCATLIKDNVSHLDRGIVHLESKYERENRSHVTADGNENTNDASPVINTIYKSSIPYSISTNTDDTHTHNQFRETKRDLIDEINRKPEILDDPYMKAKIDEMINNAVELSDVGYDTEEPDQNDFEDEVIQRENYAAKRDEEYPVPEPPEEIGSYIEPVSERQVERAFNEPEDIEKDYSKISTRRRIEENMDTIPAESDENFNDWMDAKRQEETYVPEPPEIGSDIEEVKETDLPNIFAALNEEHTGQQQQGGTNEYVDFGDNDEGLDEDDMMEDKRGIIPRRNHTLSLNKTIIDKILTRQTL